MIKHLKKIHYHIKKPRHNRHHEFLAAFIIALIFSTNVLVPFVSATSMVNSKDMMSSSLASATASHTIGFTTGISLNSGDKIRITFPTGFSGIASANVVCPGSSTASTSGQDVICTASGLIAAGALSVIVNSVTNPATTTSYLISIRTQNSSDNTIEHSDISVAIVDRVVMTATVSATLQFTVSGTSTGATVNGFATTATTTATSTPFGILTAGATSTVAQDLSVTTNAANGYVVTVEQDQELHNSSGSNINSFDNSADGTGSTTPHAWDDPIGTLDQTNTYGHMGLTTNDSNILADGGPHSFAGGLFAGLSGTSTMQIMRHTGPADGDTQDKGRASVLYAVKISALQEAGDYTNTLTYICTPTY